MFMFVIHDHTWLVLCQAEIINSINQADCIELRVDWFEEFPAPTRHLDIETEIRFLVWAIKLNLVIWRINSERKIWLDVVIN